MRQLIIGAIYQHPKNDINQFLGLLQSRLNFFSSQHSDVCLLGDFNVNLDPQVRFASTTEYLNTLVSNGMLPLISIYTRVSQTSKTIIDHLFTNITSRYIDSGIYIYELTDHYPIFCVLHSDLKKTSNSSSSFFYYRDFKKTDYTSFFEGNSKSYSNFNINSCLTLSTELNQIFDQFVATFYQLVNKHAPLKKASKKKQKLLAKPWLTKIILISIKRKQQLYKTDYVNGNEVSKYLYKMYANKLTKIIAISKKFYYRDQLTKLINNPRQIWNLINSLLHNRNKHKTFPTKIQLNNECLTDPKLISESFNNHFCQIGKKPSK